MPNQTEFVYEVMDLAKTITGYKTGKSGQNGLCDCIGLIMGAMAQLGHGSYPMHSTNYFVRYQMQWVREMDPASLRLGHVVYEATDSTDDLHERYKPGGRYYTGDMMDSYHVGVVTSVNPLEITHCTQNGSVSGIKRDGTASGWTHYGAILGVEYLENANMSKEEIPLSKTAYVTSTDGNPVRMRESTSTSAETIAKLPVGSVVEVIETGTDSGIEWSTIVDAEGRRGYMMTRFLKALEHAEEATPNEGEKTVENGFEQEVLTRLTRIEEKLEEALGGVG